VGLKQKGSENSGLIRRNDSTIDLPAVNKQYKSSDLFFVNKCSQLIKLVIVTFACGGNKNVFGLKNDNCQATVRGCNYTVDMGRGEVKLTVLFGFEKCMRHI